MRRRLSGVFALAGRLLALCILFDAHAEWAGQLPQRRLSYLRQRRVLKQLLVIRRNLIDPLQLYRDSVDVAVRPPPSMSSQVALRR